MNLAITGPTSGIGAVTFQELCPAFDQVFLLARNKEKADLLLKSLPQEEQGKVIFVSLDLADLDSVKNAAQTISNNTKSLDVLINNAGGIFPKKQITKDGFELTLSANHLGHFLLTHHLMPLLLKSDGPKVINVSSEAHRAAKVDFLDLNYEHHRYSSFNAYANVKLFNILFTKSLVEKYGEKGLASYALHPGVVNTNFGKEASGIFNIFWKLAKPFMISPKEGAQTSIFLVKSKLSAKQNGYYFKNKKPMVPSGSARSKDIRNELWEISEKMLKNWL
ncbi:SDR family NAD(P)-dependent oxidoreductase [Shivajiella indica]|uniref:SDR family NAD(P)-dependent oxidoreductase n=1 Tax=Shivajiella indica TaxID=872115 RepID=A0ABW5B5A6_9BACT